jgi:hypothetical protein
VSCPEGHWNCWLGHAAFVTVEITFVFPRLAWGTGELLSFLSCWWFRAGLAVDEVRFPRGGLSAVTSGRAYSQRASPWLRFPSHQEFSLVFTIGYRTLVAGT